MIYLIIDNLYLFIGIICFHLAKHIVIPLELLFFSKGVNRKNEDNFQSTISLENVLHIHNIHNIYTCTM